MLRSQKEIMSLPADHLPATERNLRSVNGCEACPVPPSCVAKELQVSCWHPKMGLSFGIWAEEIFWSSETFLASLYGKPVAIRKVWDLANFVCLWQVRRAQESHIWFYSFVATEENIEKIKITVDCRTQFSQWRFHIIWRSGSHC